MIGALGWLINLMKIGPAKTIQLRIQVREITPCEQFVAKVITGHDMAGMEGDLLRFHKEIIGIPVQGHLADRLNRHQIFGDKLGSVEDESKSKFSSSSSATSCAQRIFRVAPASMASPPVTRRWKSGSLPLIFCASSQTTE